jgi:CHASE2 domain-containing sensor protein
MNLAQTRRQLAARSTAYWLSAVVSVVLGMTAGFYLDREDFAIETRYRVHGVLQNFLHGDRHAKRTALVLIDDEEFWLGELGHRLPLKRTYLAKLLRKVDEGQPALIGLDFNLRSPVVDGSRREHPDYARETQDLIDAVRDVSRRQPVVLPATFRHTPAGLVLDSAVYTGADWRPGHVSIGHILPPPDMRRVPVTERMADETRLYSFAAAIAEALDPAAVEPFKDSDTPPVSTFLPAADFPVLSSRAVLAASEEQLRRALRAKVVILGAAWNERAFQLPPQIDQHLTPIGYLGGAYVQANWVEALLDSRVYPQLDRVLAIALEALLSLAVAVVFALRIGALHKLAWILGLCLGGMLLGYLLLQNLGVYFDFYLPVLVLAVHTAVAKVLEWREQAHRLQASQPPAGS